MLTYHRPPTLQEALQIRASSDVIVLAGGTDVYPAKAARSGCCDMAHKDVLDIGALSGLRGILEEAAHWRIGALTTWTDLIDADLPPLLGGLQLAARVSKIAAPWRGSSAPLRRPAMVRPTCWCSKPGLNWPVSAVHAS